MPKLAGQLRIILETIFWADLLTVQKKPTMNTIITKQNNTQDNYWHMQKLSQMNIRREA